MCFADKNNTETRKAYCEEKRSNAIWETKIERNNQLWVWQRHRQDFWA